MSDLFVEMVPDDDENSDVDDSLMDDDVVINHWEYELQDLNAFMAAAIDAGKAEGVDAKNLSKMWRISFDDAK